MKEVLDDYEEEVQETWICAKDGVWWYHSGECSVWINKRPTYCDRGHFMSNTQGSLYIDEADSFPRYFMDLERAKLEMKEWLKWRIQQNRKTNHAAAS